MTWELQGKSYLLVWKSNLLVCKLQKKIIFATLGIPPDLPENVSYDHFVLSCQWRAATMTWELHGEGDLQDINICESLEIFKK